MIYGLLIALISTLSLKDSVFMSNLDSVLTFAHLSRNDLLFERKTFKEDSFHLPIIDSAIANPFYLVRESGSLANYINRDSTLPLLYRDAIRLLAFVKYKPQNIYSGVDSLIGALLYATQTLKMAFGGLNKYEQDSLLFESTYLFADEDDTTMRKKRGIIRLTENKIDSVPGDRYLEILSRVKREYIYEAGLVFIENVEEFLNNHNKSTFRKGKFKKDGINVYVGSDSVDVYTVAPPFVIIDPGGDDKYYIEKGKAFAPSLIIDLGGNDVYEGDDVSLGGGLFSVSGIWDTKGNDTYKGGIISLGSGLLGVGVLYDGGGENVFKGAYFSEGAGFCGVGILYSRGEDDYYSIWDFGEGFGGTWGIGILKDEKGDDVYRAGFKFLHIPLLPHSTRSFAQGFAMGFRPDAHGGVGILYDERGNDQYIAEAFAQGTSYWKSLGLLFDLEGNDRYIATEYAQGAGIHLAAGALYDLKGDDHYFSRFGPSQGEGHDYSVGILMDLKGDDVYHVSGGLGVGLYNSVGIFCDFEGNDVYSTYEKWGLGSVNPGRGTFGIGVFMDLGGIDHYMSRRRKNNLRTFEYSGVFYDRK